MTPQQLDELRGDEGTRLLVYDDATGKPIRPGSIVVGHPTIGTGRALDVHGITGEEDHYLLTNDVAAVEAALDRLDWYQHLDQVRQGVMTNLAFNMGIRGLESFVHMLSEVEAGEHDLAASMTAMASQEFNAAADQLASSKWATQVQPSRRDRLLKQLRTGVLAPVLTAVPSAHAPIIQPPEVAPQPIIQTDDAMAEALNEAELARIRGEN